MASLLSGLSDRFTIPRNNVGRLSKVALPTQRVGLHTIRITRWFGAMNYFSGVSQLRLSIYLPVGLPIKLFIPYPDQCPEHRFGQLFFPSDSHGFFKHFF